MLPDFNPVIMTWKLAFHQQESGVPGCGISGPQLLIRDRIPGRAAMPSTDA